MPIGSTASTQPDNWKLRKKDFKHYFHFDARHSRTELEYIARDDEQTATHAFFPLILFKEQWTKFRKGPTRKRKTRPLRYASRMDAAIFAYRRFVLSRQYEDYLVAKNISDIPIAYRSMIKGSGRGNKCNIDFAKDAFDCIRSVGHCDVTVIDISSYFESLDHEKLRVAWEAIVDRPLNPAEIAVFNAVTKYTVVDRDALFERLGLYNFSGGTNRKEKRMRNIDKLKKGHKRQICSPSEFRSLVCGADSQYPSLLRKNSKPTGIPQGTPISDLLANVYLHDFDKKVGRWTRRQGGKVYRYCDDILVILPRKNGVSFLKAKNYLSKLITREYPELKIKEEKIAIGRFIPIEGAQIYTSIAGNASRNGLEYLGFQFDGQSVQIKDATISNAWRKLKKRSYGWAKRWVDQYKLKGNVWLRDNAPIQDKVTEVLKSVSQTKSSEYSELTFRKYVERAELTFAEYDTKFGSQIRRYKRLCKRQFEVALERFIEKKL